MNNAAIIIIGNEILSGRTLDQNANFIAKRCSKLGILLEEVIIIPDVEKTIIKSVKDLSKNLEMFLLLEVLAQPMMILLQSL